LALLMLAGNAQSASLEKIEVASHIGEPFFAEVPLKLEANELASKVFVEIAAPADYKIFEVYRDPVLKAIRADVASDARGVRVELSSRSRIQSPFFNLVLKIRYGRVSNFKKFSVFLDAPQTVQQAAEKAPQPTVVAVKQPAAPHTSLTASAGEAIAPAVVKPVPADQQPAKYYDGWARTDRYGPIVRGDSLSIVAERLRVDYRYTRNQIMLALFENNSSSFEQANMNLMKAGSFLKVPTAAEIERHSKSEATRALAEHENAWKKLTRQPRYAAEAEAQRTRYSKRISIGEHADGVSTAPVTEAASVTAAANEEKSVNQPASSVTSVARPDGQSSAATETVAVTETAADQPIQDRPVQDQTVQNQTIQDETNQTLIRLQEQNEILKQQLIGTQKSIEALTRKVEQDHAATAAKVRMEKLEVMISGLQSELKKMHQQPTIPVTGMNWMIWLLIALVVILLAVVAMLMRRELAHPAASKVSIADNAAKSSNVEEPSQSSTDDTLAAVIENEVAGIETGETIIPVFSETATIDSLPAFTDELSDTDTAELEPFNADTEVEPDADIDYVAEADVYIRYGMDDEAIKQLDMALRLQPDNVEAHIKKAELLLGKSDRHGFDETFAAATMTLAATDLERFKSAVERLGSDTDQTVGGVFSDEIVTDKTVADAEEHASVSDSESRDQDTLPLDVSAADDLDFDLASLDINSEDLTGELELPEVEADRKETETLQLGDANDHEAEDLPWLHDEVFDSAAEEDGLLQQEIEPTPELSSPELSPPILSPQTEELPDFDVIGGATQELDNLLSEFDDEDDGLDFINTQGVLEASGIEQGKENPGEDDAMGRTIAIDSDHEATQELDSLLAEFSDEDELPDMADTVTGLDASFFDQTETAQHDKDNEIAIDIDHGATQELDHLLGEFANEEDEHLQMDMKGLDTDSPCDTASTHEVTDSRSREGATQVLGRLLDEFNDDDLDDEEDHHKKS